MPNARRSNKVTRTITVDENLNILDDVTEDVEPETVLVILQKNLIMKVRGKVTQNLYIFNGAGTKIDVDKRDIEGINEINTTHVSCCGGRSSPYFEIL